MTKNFYQWWVFLEADNVEDLKNADDAQEKPSHTKTLRDSLKINPSTLVGTVIPFTGTLGDKTYNMVGLTVLGFDNPDNPTRVKLSITNSNDSPNMDDEVRFKDDKTKTDPDKGDIDISLEEFDKILGKGWEPAIQGQGGIGGGMGMGGGMPGAGPLGM